MFMNAIDVANILIHHGANGNKILRIFFVDLTMDFPEEAANNTCKNIF